jgi:hypothetical protein
MLTQEMPSETEKLEDSKEVDKNRFEAGGVIKHLFYDTTVLHLKSAYSTWFLGSKKQRIYDTHTAQASKIYFTFQLSE